MALSLVEKLRVKTIVDPLTSESESAALPPPGRAFEIVVSLPLAKSK
jgi:hypothetical protein